MKLRHLFWIIPVALVGLLVSCAPDSTGSVSASDQARNNASQNQAVNPGSNNIEVQNINARVKIAADPSTIMWCTYYPPTPGVKPFTVPVVGKLTSSTKRLTPGAQTRYQETYNPDLPDIYGTYGSSDSYRFGFTPSGMYTDFTDLPSFCTNDLSDYAQSETIIIRNAVTTQGPKQ